MDYKPKTRKKRRKKESKKITDIPQSNNQIDHKTKNEKKQKIKADNNQNNYIENKTPIEKQEIEKKISQEVKEKEEEKLNLKDKDKKIQKKEEYIPYSCITGLEKDDLSFPKPLTEK